MQPHTAQRCGRLPHRESVRLQGCLACAGGCWGNQKVAGAVGRLRSGQRCSPQLEGCLACAGGVLGDRRLVQGQWGGSVLDSVVGVFLTQNVSDALSSKAWMSLAATFPLPASQQDGIDSMDWEAVRTAPVEQVMLQQSDLHSNHCKIPANWNLAGRLH